MLLTSNNLQQIIIFSKIKHTYIQTLKNGKAHQQKGHDFSSSRAFNFQAHATLHKIRIDSKVFVKRLYSKNYFQLSHSFLSMKHANIAQYGGHYVDPELVPTYQWCDYGPDCLCLLRKIAACYFLLVIYSLLFLYNSLLCRK